MRNKSKIFLSILILLSLVLLGCNNDKQDTITQDTVVKKEKMELKSSAFENGGVIPDKYGCKGENVNPPFEISNVPEKSKSLALIMDDPDAPVGTFDHWLVWNISPLMKEMPEKSIPDDAVEGKNDFGKTGYGGPCPPDGTHRYYFRLYALTGTLSGNISTKDELLKAMEGKIIDKAELMGKYTK